MNLDIAQEIRSLTTSKKGVFGIWCVHEILKRSDLISLIECKSNNHNVFKNVEHLLMDIWQNHPNSISQKNVTKAEKYWTILNNIEWFVDDGHLAELSEDQFSLAESLLGSVEFLLKYFSTSNDQDLVSCAQIVYDFSDYEISFELTQNRFPEDKERKDQLAFLDILSSNQFKLPAYDAIVSR